MTRRGGARGQAFVACKRNAKWPTFPDNPRFRSMAGFGRVSGQPFPLRKRSAKCPILLDGPAFRIATGCGRARRRAFAPREMFDVSGYSQISLRGRLRQGQGPSVFASLRFRYSEITPDSAARLVMAGRGSSLSPSQPQRAMFDISR
jgi:hypothetical protein